jgi:hypothetical protein
MEQAEYLIEYQAEYQADNKKPAGEPDQSIIESRRQK